MAIRNQEGALLGLTGDKCGDILYWLEEGFNRVHGDSLSTLKGHADTSVSPIFIAAGAGVQHGFYTDRVILPGRCGTDSGNLIGCTYAKTM